MEGMILEVKCICVRSLLFQSFLDDLTYSMLLEESGVVPRDTVYVAK